MHIPIQNYSSFLATDNQVPRVAIFHEFLKTIGQTLDELHRRSKLTSLFAPPNTMSPCEPSATIPHLVEDPHHEVI